jgi:hypothetical protein
VGAQNTFGVVVPHRLRSGLFLLRLPDYEVLVSGQELACIRANRAWTISRAMKILDDLFQYSFIVFGFERDLKADSIHAGKALS